MRRFLPTFILLGILAIPAPSWSQEQEPKAKSLAGTVMPWRLLGIDPDTHQRAKPALTASQQALTERWLQDRSTLTEFVAKQATINQKRFADTIATGTPQPTATIVEPLLCSVTDHYVMFLQLASLADDKLLASAHSLLSKQDLARALEGGSAPALIRQSLMRLYERFKNKVEQGTNRKDTALKVGLRLAKESTRQDTGSFKCLNLLAAETLASDYHVIRPVGTELVMHTKRLSKDNQQYARATRTLVMHWTIKHPSYRTAPRLPATYDLVTSVSESVFAQRLVRLPASQHTLAKQGDQLSLTLSEPLMQTLQTEANALVATDLPQVARVYGAWVYLDRGRAYGLKMHDRLVVQDAPDAIKGHVVGFYGPNLGLKSPRGYRISEGAIVFIRKGQRDTKIGQTLTYDTRRFPTPFPMPTEKGS